MVPTIMVSSTLHYSIWVLIVLVLHSTHAIIMHIILVVDPTGDMTCRCTPQSVCIILVVDPTGDVSHYMSSSM